MNELKKLAVDMVLIQESLKKETLREWDRDELSVELNNIRNTIIQKGYSVDTFVSYMEEYKTLSITDSVKWRNE